MAPATQASPGIGSRVFMDLGVTPNDFQELPEPTQCDPPPQKLNTVKATHMSSPGQTEEEIPTIHSQGPSSLAFNFLVGDQRQMLLYRAKQAKRLVNWRIIYPQGNWRFGYAGYVTDITETNPMENKIEIKVQITCSGVPEGIVPHP